MLDILINWIKKPEKETQNKTPEGICSVCWGYQGYDKKIRTLYYDRQIDVNNHQDKYMLIQNFIKTHIEGIKLKEGKISTCPKCGHKENNQ
ncbi:MAG: hypothetical protein HYU68_10520 [Bacteroidetes bacterium]|nr:hypothetical protein [Bacteroidota bacterium]